MLSVTETVTQNAFVNITDSYLSNNIADPWWCVHFHFGQPPPKKVQGTVFAPPQEDKRGATEPLIQPKAYVPDVQPEDPIDSGTGHIYQTGGGPNMVNYRVHMEPFYMLHYM